MEANPTNHHKEGMFPLEQGTIVETEEWVLVRQSGKPCPMLTTNAAAPFLNTWLSRAICLRTIQVAITSDFHAQ